ncbi:hypothetical protein A9Q99_22525 [Gammaproteobacteria bacterium 45_16_T64]|nr:hypothetical protein A9Q99_22525 [Gammaproteobacteria bacterium 45_16_T64]
MDEQSPQDICNELVAKYAPSISRSMLVQVTAQALANAAQNATFAQQQQNVIINANTAVSAGLLHAMGAAYSKK